MSALSRYLKGCMARSVYPTLLDSFYRIYAPDEGAHVQYASAVGEVRVLHNGYLLMDFDIYNPMGSVFRVDMWHAGHWEVYINYRLDIDSVRFSERTRHIDYPNAYRYVPEYRPRLLVSYLDGMAVLSDD